MPFLKQSTCTQCGRKFTWKIERPSDGFWDRWKSDDGDTLATWFLQNNLCWDHAYEKMPERFQGIIRTVLYEESGTPEKAV